MQAWSLYSSLWSEKTTYTKVKVMPTHARLLPCCQEILFKQHPYKKELIEVKSVKKSVSQKLLTFVAISNTVILSYMVVGWFLVPLRHLRFYRLLSVSTIHVLLLLPWNWLVKQGNTDLWWAITYIDLMKMNLGEFRASIHVSEWPWGWLE